MDWKKLLVVGALIAFIFVSSGIWSSFSYIFADLESEGELMESSDNPAEVYLSFNNSTPQSTAMSIARLTEGVSGFYNDGSVVNASLSSDKKYWIVHMDDFVVNVDSKTLMSKKIMTGTRI